MTVPALGCCNPMIARNRLLLPEPEGPTRLTNWPVLDTQVRAFENRLGRHS